MPTFFTFELRRSSNTRTSCSGCGKGKGRSRTAYTTLKVATLAPIPRARVSTATIVKPGLFANIRSAYRISWISDSMSFSFVHAYERAWLLSSLCTDARKSFFTQSDQRIHACCASSRNVAREKRHGSKHGRDGAESDGVGGIHVEQHGAHES